MDDFLLAARRFADVAERRIDLLDLGLALFLEYFSWPLLRFTSYVRLQRRELLPTLAVEFRAWLVEHMPASIVPIMDPMDADDTLVAWAQTVQTDDQSPILELVGRGLHRRWLMRRGEMRRANRVSQIALLCAITLHGLIAAAVITTNAGLLVGWLCAMIFATLICVSNRHWRSRAGFRRAPR